MKGPQLRTFPFEREVMDQEEALLKDEPGNPIFAEYGERLRASGNYAHAFEVCFAGLSANPGCHRGRLLLARLHYEKRYIPFAIQELERLHSELPDNRSVAKLLEKFKGASVTPEAELDSQEKPSTSTKLPSNAGSGDGEGNAPVSGTMAEAEFDFDVLDEIEEENKK